MQYPLERGLPFLSLPMASVYPSLQLFATQCLLLSYHASFVPGLLEWFDNFLSSSVQGV